jgi:hypothetical protein
MSDRKDLAVLDVNDLTSIETILNEVDDAFYDIPFGNSAFQTKAFVVAAAITPERAYRTVGLQLMNNLQSIRNALISKKKLNILIEQKKEKLNDDKLDKFEKQLIDLELLTDYSSLKQMEKPLNDSFNEFKVLYSEYKKLPKFTREQFENAELNYFTQSLTRQAQQLDGSIQSIVNMMEDMPALNAYTKQLSEIEKIDSETLEKLRLDMPNQFENIAKRAEKIKQNASNTSLN